MMPAINELILAVSSSLAASIVVKATLLIALGLTGTAAARRSRAAVRHTLLAVTFGMLLLLPVAAVVAPPVRLVLPAAAQKAVAPAPSGFSLAIPAATDSGSAATPVQRSSGLPVTTLVLAAWTAGLALFLVPIAVGLWQVRALRRSALPSPKGQTLADRLALDTGIRRRVEVLLHEDLPGPMTCGFLHPAIVLPMESDAWDHGDLNRAIVHELEHVRRADWLTQCLARVVCAAYWFHPLVWMAWRQLTLQAERSCDDAVLRNSEATAYADQLVGLAQRLSSAGKSPLLAMVNRSDLATRVGAVLDSRQQRGRAGVIPMAAACAAAAALILTVAPFRMVAAPPSPVAVAEPVSAAQPSPEPAPPIAAPDVEPAPAPDAAAVPVSQPASEPAPQTPSPAPQTGPAIQFNARSNLVMVNVTVTDLAGNSIDGLGARDFSVIEDGVAQTISVFEFQRLAAGAGKPNAPNSYYTLGYYTSNTNQDGQFRKIQVIDKTDTTAKLEFRSGYYANKQFVNQNGATANAGTGVVQPAGNLPPGSRPPVLIYKKEADYSEEARKAKYQGTVTLYVEVDETGHPMNIKVLHAIGLGLDEKAIEAVKQWVFKPGTANGVPVTMATQVTVDFRLL